MAARLMVLAGGTGGHVYPALAAAQELASRGWEIAWLGARDGFEARVVPGYGFPIDLVDVRKVRGEGIGAWVQAPVRLLRAMAEAAAVLRRRRPAVVLGMGGFVAGPGGLVARLLGMPLVIHEQNAIPGLTNRWLARVATRVLQAFPDTFPGRRRADTVGNPVRADIVALPPPEQRYAGRSGPARVLVVGGSLGAQALNDTVPAALARLPAAVRPDVRHQAGRGKAETTEAAYRAAGVAADVTEFLVDMAGAYGWADLVVCRAGALTVSELAAAGVPAVLVPYPFAVDDHQTRNAAFLAEAGAGLLLPQRDLTPARLGELLADLLGDTARLRRMAQAARGLTCPDAARRVADACEEAARR